MRTNGAHRPDLARALLSVLESGSVVQEKVLAEVLSEFARTLITDFPVQAILDHLVGRIVEVLPITSAGVTLISAGMEPRYIAASDELALRFEQLQSELGDGPCLTAFETGEAVAVPDLRGVPAPERFTEAADSAGLAAVFALPLRHGDHRIGALDLYRDTPGEIDARDMGVAQTLADVAAAYLLNAQAREDALAVTDRLQHSAFHDPLTGLPNRALLQQRLEHAALRARRSRANVAILFVDLDRFKQVNDTFGHQVGDQLLVAVAHRLLTLVRAGDTLARFSGDEFVFLCEDVRSEADAQLLASRIDDAFAEPFALPKMQLTVTASVGLAFAGPGQSVSDELLANADIAMYQAKRRGGDGHHVFDLREALRAQEGHSLEADLRAAFAGGHLDVAYQPIVRCGDGSIAGVEALLRWTHPDRGAVPPISMVATAEQSNLINEIGAWVLERSCRDRRRWLDEHPGVALEMAVNVSTRQLMSRDFFTIVDRVLDRTAMDPTGLILEITENGFIEDSERANTVLLELKDLGVRIALDDFGTGYSSLGYLRRLPIDIVKIDQSFIADIGLAHQGGALVGAVTNMAHALDLTVTAEGVETQAQLDEVRSVGCESAQGYFCGRPMTASAIDGHLSARPASPQRWIDVR